MTPPPRQPRPRDYTRPNSPRPAGRNGTGHTYRALTDRAFRDGSGYAATSGRRRTSHNWRSA